MMIIKCRTSIAGSSTYHFMGHNYKPYNSCVLNIMVVFIFKGAYYRTHKLFFPYILNEVAIIILMEFTTNTDIVGLFSWLPCPLNGN